MMSDCLLLQDELDYEPDELCEPSNDIPSGKSKNHVNNIEKDQNRNGLKTMCNPPDSSSKIDLIKDENTDLLLKTKPVTDDFDSNGTIDFSNVDLNNIVLVAHGRAKRAAVQNNNDETFKLSSVTDDAVKIETITKKPFSENNSSGVQNDNDETFNLSTFENNDPAKTKPPKKKRGRKKKVKRAQSAIPKQNNKEIGTQPTEEPPLLNTLPRPKLSPMKVRNEEITIKLAEESPSMNTLPQPTSGPMNFCISFSTNSATRMIEPKVIPIAAPLKAEPVAQSQSASTDLFHSPKSQPESTLKTIRLNVLQETEPSKTEAVRSQSILTDLYGPSEPRPESKKVWKTKYLDSGGVQLSSRDSVISYESDEEPLFKRQRLESSSSRGSLKLSLRRPSARKSLVEPSTSEPKMPIAVLNQTADQEDDLISMFAETVSDLDEKRNSIVEPNLNCNTLSFSAFAKNNDENLENYYDDISFPEMISNGQPGGIEKRCNQVMIPLVFRGLCYYHFFNLNGKMCNRNPCFRIHNLYPLTPAINGMHFLTEDKLLEAYNFARLHPNFFIGLLPKFLQSFAIKKMFDQMIASVEHLFDPALLRIENYNQVAMLGMLCQTFVEGRFADFYGSVQFIIDKCLENVPQLGDTMANLIIDLPDLPLYWPLVKEIILAQKVTTTTGERLLLALKRFSLDKNVAEDVFKSALKLKFIDTNKYQNRIVLKHFMEMSSSKAPETAQPLSQQNVKQQNHMAQNGIANNIDSVCPNKSLGQINVDRGNVASESISEQPTLARLSEINDEKSNFVSSYVLCESWLQNSCTPYDPNQAINPAQASNTDTSSSSDSDSTRGSSKTVRAQSDSDNQAEPEEERLNSVLIHAQPLQEQRLNIVRSGQRRMRYIQDGPEYDPLNDYVNPIRQPNGPRQSEAIVSSTSDVRLTDQHPPEQPKFGRACYDPQFEFNVNLHNMYLKKLENVDINEEDVFRLNEAIDYADGDLFLELLHKYRCHNTIQNFITMTLADLRNMKKRMADKFESLLQSIETTNPKYYGDRLIRTTLEVITMNILFELDHRLKYKEADKLLQRFTDWDSLISAKLFFTLRTLSPVSRLLFIAKLVCYNRPQLTFEILYAPRLHILDHYNSWPYPNSPLPTYEVLEYDLKFRNAVLKMFLKDAYLKNISVVIEFYKIAFNKKEGIFKFDGDLSEYFDNMIVDIINKNEVVYLKQIQANIGLFSDHMLSETLRGYICCMYSTLTKLDLFKLYEKCVNKNIYPCVNRNGKVETEILIKTNLLDIEIELIILNYFYKLTESDKVNSDLKILIRQPNVKLFGRLNILKTVRSVDVINKVVKDTLLKCCSVKSSSNVLEEILVEKRSIWNYLDENKFG